MSYLDRLPEFNNKAILVQSTLGYQMAMAYLGYRDVGLENLESGSYLLGDFEDNNGPFNNVQLASPNESLFDSLSDEITWYNQLLGVANDTDQSEDTRLKCLTELVDQARLNEVPLLPYNPVITPQTNIPPSALVIHNETTGVEGVGFLHIGPVELALIYSARQSFDSFAQITGVYTDNASLVGGFATKEDLITPSGDAAQFWNGNKAFAAVAFNQLASTPTTLAGYGISASDTLFDNKYLQLGSQLQTLNTTSGTPLTTTTTVIEGFGRLQNQVSARELSLGNPAVNGYVLSSTTAGVRSWIPVPSGTAVTGISLTGTNGITGAVVITAGNAVITAGTNRTGMLKGNGTAISAATEMTDYIGITGAADGDTIVYDGTAGVATWAPGLSNPMDTLGDMIIGGALGATTKLAGNTTTTRKFLMSVGASGAALAQTYETLLAGDIPDIAIAQVTNLQTTLDQRLSDNLLSGQIFIGNLSDLATGVVPSGDWTIDTTGVATIEPNAVTFDKFIQATGPQILVGTPDILGVQDFRQITLDPATLQIDAFGVMSSIATGTGTVTNTNTLTLNSLVLGDGGTAVKVGGGFTTDGVSQLTLGVSGTSVGGLLLTNITSGTIELRPVTGALGTTVLTLFAGSDTLVGLAATQTLTNKTLTNPQINGALLQTSSTVGYVWTATNTTGAGSWQAPTGGGGTTTNSLTIDNSGTGAASGTTFNGSASRTISSNTILPSFTGNNGLYLRLNSSTGLPEWASAGGSSTKFYTVSATVPDAFFDNTQGYVVGSEIFCTLNDTYYRAFSVGTGTAAWNIVGIINYFNQNTALGFDSGLNNTGTYVTFFGAVSGWNNTGISVTAIGENSGINNSGSSVTFLGYNSGFGNSGTNVTALGRNAGKDNTADDLVAVGPNAGYNNIRGNVTAIGYSAGYNNIKGNIVLLGQNAQATADNQFSVRVDTNKQVIFDFLNITADREYLLPNNSGTLVAAAGTVSQYIRGDGTLANFPTSGGGGSSLSYYLNGSVTQFGTYKQMNRMPVIGAGTNFTLNNTTGYALMAQFVTDANDPSLLNIPAGSWDIGFYFSSSNNTGNPAFYVELLKYDGTTFTTIANNSANPEIISNGTAVDLYNTSIAVSSTSLTITDRLVIRVYVDTAGSRTITFHTEDNNLAQIITTFTTGLTAFNGLTAQVQFLGAVGTAGNAPAWTSTTATHTLDIPLANAGTGVTAGLISNTEFNIFNDKMSNPMTAEGDIIYGGTVTGGVAAPTVLPIGSNGKVLTVVSGVPAWGTVPSMTYPGAGIANSTGTAWGTSYTTTGSGTVLALATSPTLVTPIVTGVATFGNGTSAGEIRLLEGSGSGSNFVALKSPATLGADLSLTFPNTTPGSGQTLVSDGSGVLSWSSNPGTTNSIYRRAYGGTVVNTTPETLLQSLLVPANTFTDGVGWQVMATTSRTNPGSNAVTFKLYINTTAAIGGVALAGTGYVNAAAAGTSSFHFCRLGFVQIASGGSRITVFVPSTASTNYALPGGTLLSSAIDWSVDQYFILTVAQTSAVSTVTCNSMQLIPQ